MRKGEIWFGTPSCGQLHVHDSIGANPFYVYVGGVGGATDDRQSRPTSASIRTFFTSHSHSYDSRRHRCRYDVVAAIATVVVIIVIVAGCRSSRAPPHTRTRYLGTKQNGGSATEVQVSCRPKSTSE